MVVPVEAMQCKSRGLSQGITHILSLMHVLMRLFADNAVLLKMLSKKGLSMQLSKGYCHNKHCLLLSRHGNLSMNTHTHTDWQLTLSSIADSANCIPAV